MKSWNFSAVLLFVFCFSTLMVSAVEPLVFGTRDIVYLGVDNINESISNSVFLEGSMRKVGGAETTLPLSKVSSANGEIAVYDGTLELTEDKTREMMDVPQSLLETAAFWVDAGTNVLSYSSNGVNWVTQWLDVREADTNAPYAYMRAVSQVNLTNALPTWIEDSAGASNQYPYVWFGGYGKGRWMNWQDPDSVARNITGIYHAFVVHGCQESYGFILGAPTDTGISGDFHIDDYSSDTALNGTIWHDHQPMQPVKTGRTFLNGRVVDGTVEKCLPDYQLLEVEAGTSAATANNFYSYRNYFNETLDYRVGGGRLCEVLIYTNRLTETERLKIERYLMDKWLPVSASVPPVTVYGSATAGLDIDSGVTQRATIEGDGNLTKSGAGTLELGVNKDTPLYNGSASLTAGYLDTLMPLPLHAADGVNYTSSFVDGLSVAPGTSGEISTLGDCSLLLGSIPAGVTKLSLGAGVTHLAQAVAEEGWPTNTAGYIPNASFEDTGETGVYNLSQGVTYGGWTALTGGNTVRFIANQWPYNGSYLLPEPAPDGSCVLLLKAVADAETTINLPVSGVYAISFLGSGRVDGSDGHTFDIVIDDTNRVATVQTTNTRYQPYRYKLPWLPAGEHVLRLESVSTVDYASALDDFHLDLLTMEPQLDHVIPNASFECSGFLAIGDVASLSSSGLDWTLTNGSGNLAVIVRKGSMFPRTTGTTVNGSRYCIVPDYGRRMLEIINQGSASTTMTFPEAGEYEISLKLARQRSITSESKNNAVLSVIVGGSQTNSVVATKEILTETSVGSFTVPANTPVSLMLKGNYSDNRAMVVDDIVVRKVVDETPLIENGNFESGASGWTMIQDPTATKVLAEVLNYNFATYAYGTNVFEGAARLKICDDGIAVQTVSFDTPGTYRLVCHANSRDVGFYGENPIALWLSHGGITNVFGYFDTYDRVFRRHAFVFNVPTAGDYDIGIEGQTPWVAGVNDRTTLIDCVSVEPVELEEFEPIVPETASVEVAQDAKLVLNFVGTNYVDKVQYNGETVSGVINNETFPEFVIGAGALFSYPSGTVIMIR